MNPIVFNCFLLFILVIVMSLLQSQFRIIKENPIGFCFTVFIFPLLVFGKASAKGMNTWTSITGFEIWAYTMMLALINVKQILPKINEAYIYAYTLLHWYFLIENIAGIGFNFWLSVIMLISVYPTLLIVKNVFVHRELNRTDKAILFYWFLFCVSFTYIDQVALHIIAPILTMDEIGLYSLFIIFFSAIQLYFISTIFTLLFFGIPLFHGGKGDSWKIKMKEWREMLNYKIDCYVEYQVSTPLVLLITLVSTVLFYYDYQNGFRAELIYIYTIVFPIVFFYLKLSPDNNLNIVSIDSSSETDSQMDNIRDKME